MTRWPGRALARAPVLLTAYLEWSNGARRGRSGRLRWRTGLIAGLAAYLAGMAAVAIHGRADVPAAIAELAWLERHRLFLAAVAALVAGVLVSRRRALHRLAAARAWTSALPVARSTARWQAIARDCAPALVMTCLLAAAFGSLCLLRFIDAGIRAPILAWVTTTAGVLVGACCAECLPAARPEELYEGSRYVPHRRLAFTPVPSGSLVPLGSWPLRQLFASARPKTVARAIVPLLLAMPLNSTAADAMLVLGLLSAIGALVLLAAAALSVSARASRWLRPLPLGSGALARSTLIPAAAAMALAAAIESWLLWVKGVSVPRCLAIGSATLATCLVVTLAGSLQRIYAENPSGR